MVTMTPKLTPDVRHAVEQNNGCSEAEIDGKKFVVMTQEIYLQMLGLASDEDIAASAAELSRRIASAKSGQANRPFREVINELGNDV